MTRVTTHPGNRPIWFELMVRDADAARRFYGAVLGWWFDISGPEMGHYTVCRIDDAPVAGIGSIAPDQDLPAAWTVYFGVTSTETAVRDVEAAGGHMVSPVEVIGAFGRMAICRDPGGAVFGVWEPGLHTGAGLVDEPGAMAWCEVNTRDAAAVSAFYQRVFALDANVMEVHGTAYHTLLQHGERVGGVLQMTADWGDVPPHWMAYFAVADADEASVRVQVSGGRVAHGPFATPYGRILVVQDPEGATISLIELASDFAR
jgi:uncharacterized protein